MRKSEILNKKWCVSIKDVYTKYNEMWMYLCLCVIVTRTCMNVLSTKESKRRRVESVSRN